MKVTAILPGRALLSVKRTVEITKPANRCGECVNCKHVEATKGLVLADSAPAGPGLTTAHATMWNQVLVDNPCLYPRVRVMHNNRTVDGQLVDQPADLKEYEVRVHTEVFGELTVHKDNISE